ncbi:MAG TPA: S8 family serine peptidase [Steroidobacteraceae bacterium]
MRAIVHACLLSLVIVSAGTENSFAAPPPATASTPGEARHARVVVTFANEPRQSPSPAGGTGRRYTGDGYLLAQSAHNQAKHVASKYSLREVANWPIRSLSIHCVVYEIPDDRSVRSVVEALSKDSNVTLAEPLSEFHTLSDTKAVAPYNDPLYDLQTNLPALGIAAAHEHAQGAGVRIALIDTGVDTRHPDLRGRIAHTRSFVDMRATTAGSYRHGTAMAGLIAAVANNHVGIVGIAPLAQLEVFEACWQLQPDSDEAVCNTFTLAKALAAALDSGSQLINMSIAGPSDPLLSALIEAAMKRGVTFVGAAAEPADAFPTGVPGVIAAQGMQRSVRLDAFSIPATHILTLRPEGQYDFESGTSVAAAELTGMIALLLSSTGSRLSTTSIVSLLKETAGTNGPAANSAVDVNAALAKLDLEQNRGRTASRSAP